MSRRVSRRAVHVQFHFAVGRRTDVDPGTVGRRLPAQPGWQAGAHGSRRTDGGHLSRTVAHTQRPACRMELAPERIRRRSPVRPAFPMDTAVDEASLHRPLRLLPGLAARRLHRRQRNDPHPHIRLKPSIRTALQSLRTPNCSESFRTRCSTIDPLVTCRCMTASLLSPRVSGHCGPPLRTTGRRTVEYDRSS